MKMNFRISVSCISLLAIAAAMTACIDSSDQTPKIPFSYKIDSSVGKDSAVMRDAENKIVPVASFKDHSGITTDFVENELILSPASDQDLADFLKKTAGKVIESNEVPAPPAGSGIPYSPERAKATFYVVQFNPDTLADLANFKPYAEQLGLQGEMTISSERAAKLLAFSALQLISGIKATPNFVAKSQGYMLNKSEEAWEKDHYLNALNFWEFTGQEGTAQTNVAAAWQYMAAHSPVAPVRVAVLDGGFWLDQNGIPGPINMPGGGVSDLPTNIPLQYDFVDKDYLAGGANPNNCTGGSPCPWHGNSSAQIAFGALNNQFGGAGTGNQVSTPILFRLHLKYSTVAAAVRSATNWGASVISMSFGGTCNSSCKDYLYENPAYYSSFVDANKAGVVLVAAAGNDTLQVNDNSIYPCILGEVLCVGALERTKNTSASFSNYGPSVDIWAPTNIIIGPNPDTWPDTTFGGGTSASAPFVAGVAAMMKALDPSLDTTKVGSILASTAHKDSTDSKVTAYIDAYRAVLAAGKSKLPADSLEPNSFPSQATSINGDELFKNLTVSSSDSDYYTITFNDYAGFRADLEFMAGLGDVNIQVTPLNGVAAPMGITEDKTDTTRTYLATLLAPGSYLVKIFKSGPALYNVSFTTGYAFVSGDPYEYNNTLTSAAFVPNGTHQATFHNTSDIDYYKFELKGPVTKIERCGFSISQKDNPLSLSILDANGNLIQQSSTAEGFELAPGTYYAKIEGQTRNRYLFTLGKMIDKSAFQFPLYTLADPWKLDPENPLEIWVNDVDDYVVQPGVDSKGLRLIGKGLHMSLLDRTGKTIGEGVSEMLPTTGEAGRSETISLTNTVAGELYVVRVTRKNLNGAIEDLSPGSVQGTIQLY